MLAGGDMIMSYSFRNINRPLYVWHPKCCTASYEL